MKSLWTIVLVILGLWLIGYLTGLGGVAIHVLLIMAITIFIYNLFQG